MNEDYRYTPDTWDLLAERAIDWLDVEHVLHGPAARVRRWHTDRVLQIAAAVSPGRWLVVTLVELVGTDHIFEITDITEIVVQEGEQR